MSFGRVPGSGCDSTELQSLFEGNDKPPPVQGAERARSATERFLFQRLQTLPETKNRFRLNANLAIAFDSLGRLEVDLLCADARVAVELDGAQHLADPIAYRRDRRKDQVLQENGYLVLRFLAEDVGTELDIVLDSILRAISHRTSATTNLLTVITPPQDPAKPHVD